MHMQKMKQHPISQLKLRLQLHQYRQKLQSFQGLQNTKMPKKLYEHHNLHFLDRLVLRMKQSDRIRSQILMQRKD